MTLTPPFLFPFLLALPPSLSFLSLLSLHCPIPFLSLLCLSSLIWSSLWDKSPCIQREWVEVLSKSITLALSSISIVSCHKSLGSVVADAPPSDKPSRIRSTSTLSHPRWPDESQWSLWKAHKYKLFIHFKSACAVGEVITYNLVLVYPLNHKN